LPNRPQAVIHHGVIDVEHPRRGGSPRLRAESLE
jgi:hypothetical protein